MAKYKGLCDALWSKEFLESIILVDHEGHWFIPTHLGIMEKNPADILFDIVEETIISRKLSDAYKLHEIEHFEGWPIKYEKILDSMVSWYDLFAYMIGCKVKL